MTWAHPLPPGQEPLEIENRGFNDGKNRYGSNTSATTAQQHADRLAVDPVGIGDRVFTGCRGDHGIRNAMDLVPVSG